MTVSLSFIPTGYAQQLQQQQQQQYQPQIYQSYDNDEQHNNEEQQHQHNLVVKENMSSLAGSNRSISNSFNWLNVGSYNNDTTHLRSSQRRKTIWHNNRNRIYNKESFVFNYSMLEVHYYASLMSYLAYRWQYDINRYPRLQNIPFDIDINFTNINVAEYSNNNNYMKFYDDEPERVVLGKIKGKCYIGFRGSFGQNGDSATNIGLGRTSICTNNSGATPQPYSVKQQPTSETNDNCCTVRKSFHDSYYNVNFRIELENDIQYCYEQTECYKNLNNNTNNDCIIFTGHSQGAAIAASGALYSYHKYNPIVINFAWPYSMFNDCYESKLLDDTRWYNHVNSRLLFGSFTRVYDIVPALPWFGQVQHYGNLFVLSEDNTGVAYIGLNDQISFRRTDIGFQTHEILAYRTNDNGYVNRLQNIIEYYNNTIINSIPDQSDNTTNNITTNSNMDNFMVRSTGYPNGKPCTYHVECQSNYCGKRIFFSILRFRNVCKDP